MEPSNGVANSVPPSKKPCELAFPSVACLKMLKTFTNLPILTFIRFPDAILLWSPDEHQQPSVDAVLGGWQLSGIYLYEILGCL